MGILLVFPMAPLILFSVSSFIASESPWQQVSCATTTPRHYL